MIANLRVVKTAPHLLPAHTVSVRSTRETKIYSKQFYKRSSAQAVSGRVWFDCNITEKVEGVEIQSV
jgi:hypothetical protein